MLLDPNPDAPTRSPKRYEDVEAVKANGATYTPPELADFVATAMLAKEHGFPANVRILDPAIGEGQLLLSLVRRILESGHSGTLEIWGFDRDDRAVEIARQRLTAACPDAKLVLKVGDFLDFAADQQLQPRQSTLFHEPRIFDLVIANPPYVRTQIIGSDKARRLAIAFGLKGRVDLYHAFVLAIIRLLAPSGTAGIIASNRFMTTRSGATIRAALRTEVALRHVWDLGDTKLFQAAVLPAVLIADGLDAKSPSVPRFTAIYETSNNATIEALCPISALGLDGIVGLRDGRAFCVQQGMLDLAGASDDVWRIATDAGDAWMAQVRSRTWATFGDVGNIRVGVKTCADKVFTRTDWSKVSERPVELLRPLTTHHVARRYRAEPGTGGRDILYPHEVTDGARRPVDLAAYPASKAYLEAHRTVLEARSYVLEAGRAWYEIWVPQDPSAWAQPKLVFRDICERPTFWVDLEGTIVNGDCYWLTIDNGDEDLIWLAAGVANSTFAEAFYDRRFNNKLYAGRRRFITQYVRHFPLPDPKSEVARQIIPLVKDAYQNAGSAQIESLDRAIDRLVWQAFGLALEKVAG